MLNSLKDLETFFDLVTLTLTFDLGLDLELDLDILSFDLRDLHTDAGCNNNREKLCT